MSILFVTRANNFFFFLLLPIQLVKIISRSSIDRKSSTDTRQLLKINISSNNLLSFTSLNQHLTPRINNSRVTIGDISSRGVAGRAADGNELLAVDGTRAGCEDPVNRACNHVEGARVDEKRSILLVVVRGKLGITNIEADADTDFEVVRKGGVFFTLLGFEDGGSVTSSQHFTFIHLDGLGVDLEEVDLSVLGEQSTFGGEDKRSVVQLAVALLFGSGALGDGATDEPDFIVGSGLGEDGGRLEGGGVGLDEVEGGTDFRDGFGVVGEELGAVGAVEALGEDDDVGLEVGAGLGDDGGCLGEVVLFDRGDCHLAEGELGFCGH